MPSTADGDRPQMDLPLVSDNCVRIVGFKNSIIEDTQSNSVFGIPYRRDPSIRPTVIQTVNSQPYGSCCGATGTGLGYRPSRCDY